MTTLRGAADLLENHMAADLWPLPTYRELLVLK
jgi:glutamine synthetase type III